MCYQLKTKDKCAEKIERDINASFIGNTKNV